MARADRWSLDQDGIREQKSSVKATKANSVRRCIQSSNASEVRFGEWDECLHESVVEELKSGLSGRLTQHHILHNDGRRRGGEGNTWRGGERWGGVEKKNCMSARKTEKQKNVKKQGTHEETKVCFLT